MNKSAREGFASTGTDNSGKPVGGYSYANSLNPLGVLYGGVKVPNWLYNMLPGSRPGASEDERNNAKLQAALITLIGGGVLVGGAVTGIGRGLKALYDARMHTDNAAKNIGGDASTTYDLAVLGKSAAVDKQAWEINYPDKLSFSTLLGVAAPVGALILASAAASKGVDALSAAARSNRIDRKMALRNKIYTDLISARARNAKGLLTDKEYADLQGRVAESVPSTVKEASISDTIKDIWNWKDWLAGKAQGVGEAVDMSGRSVIAALGLIAAGVAGAAGIASYTYTKASDPDNIKYKAIEKGLQEYAKGKSSTTPITMLAPNKAFFDKLDQGAPQKTIRDLPQVTTDDINKPLSMTL